MNIQLNRPVIQAKQQAFLETLSVVLNEKEEQALYDRALDTYYEKGVDPDGSLSGVPPILAAHTFKEAKSSLSALMPKADLEEIRQASNERPEVARWVSLLDTSSDFLKELPERAPTTLTPLPSVPQTPAQVDRPFETVAPSQPILQETVQVASLEHAEDFGEAKELLVEAVSLSERAVSGYSQAEASAQGSRRSLDGALSNLSYSEEQEVGSAIGSGASSAKGLGEKAGDSAERAVDLSQDTERAIRSALNLLPEHEVADELRRLMDSCGDAREHGQEGLSDLDTAESRLRSALDQANYLVEAGPGEKLALEAMEAESTAGEGASAFGNGAWEFRDASTDQDDVTEGLRRVMGSL